MNNNEAKFILNAYRPGGRDADDATFGAALEQARNDPTLGAWFAREQAHGAALMAKLREIAPPPGLREAILTGGRMSGPAGRARRVRRIQPVWLAIAASVAVLLSALAWWRTAPVQGDTFDEFAVNYVAHGFRLQRRSGDVAELKAWLGEKHGPLPEALPAKFAELRALGCRTLDFRGHDVSLVCFERGGKEFHVFVARLDEAAAADAVPRFVDHGKLVAATWTDTKNRYVLVSDAGMDAVKRLL